jgi:hypothetical protein
MTTIDLNKIGDNFEKWPSNTIITDIKVKYNSKDNQSGTNSNLISGFIDNIILSDGKTSKEIGNSSNQGPGIDISVNCKNGFENINFHKFDRQYIIDLYPPVNSFRTKPFGTYTEFYKIDAICDKNLINIPNEDLPASKYKNNKIISFDINNDDLLADGSKKTKNYITDIKYNLDKFTLNKFEQWIPNMKINHISGRSSEVIDNIFLKDNSNNSVQLGKNNLEIDNIKKQRNSSIKPFQDISINCPSGFDNLILHYWDRNNIWYKNYFLPEELNSITDFYKFTAKCGNESYELNSFFGNDPLKSKDIPRYENNKIYTKDFDKNFFYVPIDTPPPIIEKTPIPIINQPVSIPVEEIEEDPFYKKWWFWTIVIICCCCSISIIAFLIFNNDNKK